VGIARVDQHRAELENLGGGVGLEAGGLEVDEGERAERPEQPLERLDLDAELARKRARGRERLQEAGQGFARVRRRCRPCTRGPGA
jgi:hypothetical protein